MQIYRNQVEARVVMGEQAAIPVANATILKAAGAAYEQHRVLPILKGHPLNEDGLWLVVYGEHAAVSWLNLLGSFHLIHSLVI